MSFSFADARWLGGVATLSLATKPGHGEMKACLPHTLRHLAQLEFLDLAGRGLGQFGEHDVARAFVARQVLAAIRDQLRRR